MTGFPLAGVMGWPVGHSRSPALHGHWLARYHVPGAYLPLPVRPENLEQALRALPALGFRGCNLTVPHKEAAIRFVDHLDASARRSGSVNTIIVLPDGSLEGRSTDGQGFIANLRDGAPGWRAGGDHPSVVIGAGGAGRAVAAALLDAGATRLRLVNRNQERAEKLAVALRDNLDLGPGRIEIWPWERRHESLAGCHLLVNATVQGMIGEPPLDLALDHLPPDAIVTDLVYTPLITPLLAAAKARGAHVVDGLGMLLHQAAPGFKAWFGVEPTVDATLREAVLGAVLR
jgi:shikimate dehydrogenase